VAVAQDWIDACPGGLAAANAASLARAVAALEAGGAAVCRPPGFHELVNLVKKPMAITDCHASLGAYLEGHPDRPAELASVEAIAAQFSEHSPHLKHMYAAPAGAPVELAAQAAEAAAEIEATRVAYRAFFQEHGLAAVLMPAQPGAPTRIDEDGHRTKFFSNEAFFSIALVTVPGVPMLALPTPGASGDGGTPTGVVLYGAARRGPWSHSDAIHSLLKKILSGV
jgi:hypothetical protein